MTPSAMTAAGRTASARAAGHRRQLRQRPAPQMPRRVSGPAAPRTRQAPAPRHGATLGARALSVVRSLPEHSLIDRLVRGRAWIPVLGILLAGIVAMQVEVLKLGTNIGRYVQRSSVLQSQNESLQASVAALNDDQRIERLAAGMGMVMPAPTTVTFVNASPGNDPSRALANIHAPDPVGFSAALANQVAAAAAATAAPGTSTITNAPSTTSGSSTSVATAVTPVSPAAGATATSASSASSTGSAAGNAAGGAGTTAPASSPGTAAQSPATGAAAIAPASSSQSGG